MSIESLAENFTKQTGGQFILPPVALSNRLQSTHAFIFDWDGVFNDGFKQGDTGSGFSEVDSMGTNLLRFGYWLTHGRLPFTAIITGERNPAAIALAHREHFDAIYFKTRNKLAALNHLNKQFALRTEEIAYCFDDVLDIPIAQACDLRFVVSRKSSPLFEQYVKDQKICDYITGQSGNTHAVREICELILALIGQFEQAVTLRSSFDSKYKQYLELRNSGETEKYTYSETNDQIKKED